jgi:hypothetical protein
VQACNEAIVKREESFRRITKIDLVGSIGEVQDPKLIFNSMFMTRHQFDEHMEILKGLSAEKFNGIIEYGEEEIDNWIIDYSMKNKYIEESIHDISHDLRYLEGELFNIKIRNEINVVLIKNYIEDCFKREIDNLTKEDQEITVETVPITVDEENKRIM